VKNFKLSRLSLLIITCLPFIAKAGVTDGLELISSESTDIKEEADKFLIKSNYKGKGLMKIHQP